MENIKQPIEKNPVIAQSTFIIILIAFMIPIMNLAPSLLVLCVMLIFAVSLNEAIYDKDIYKYRKPTILVVWLSFTWLLLKLMFCVLLFDDVRDLLRDGLLGKWIFILLGNGIYVATLGAIVTFITTCMLIHYRHGIYKKARTIPMIILNGFSLIILYVFLLLHINTFATYSNLVYVIEQSDCSGLCLHVGVGDLSEVFKKNDKYHPLATEDFYKPIVECTIFHVKRKQEDWKFKIIKGAKTH